MIHLPLRRFGEPRLSAMRFIHMDGPDGAPQGRVLDLWVEVAPFPNVWDLQSRTILMSWARPLAPNVMDFFQTSLAEIGRQMAEMAMCIRAFCVFSWLPSDSSGILKPKSWLLDKKSLHADKHDSYYCCKEPWCLDFCLFFATHAYALLQHRVRPVLFWNTLSRLWMPKALQA